LAVVAMATEEAAEVAAAAGLEGVEGKVLAVAGRTAGPWTGNT